VNKQLQVQNQTKKLLASRQADQEGKPLDYYFDKEFEHEC